MSQDIEKYRTWVRQGQHRRASGIYFMAKGIIEELGEEKGKELIIKQVYDMGNSFGAARKKMEAGQSHDNEIKHYFNRSMDPDNVYAFAWVGETVSRSEDERVVEWQYCPIAEGFKNYGEDGVKIGELFCEHIDNAVAQGYNSDYMCVRESSLNLDGLCRLHFKKKP